MCSRTFLQPPVELYTSATLLKNQGFEVEVYDFRIMNLTADEAVHTIAIDTDLIIISTSPYDMTQMYHMDYRYQYAEFFAKILKTHFKNAFIFGVGAQCTLKPELFLKKTSVDGVIQWEIERTICELSKSISMKRGFSHIPNLVLNDKNDNYVRTGYDKEFAHPDTPFFDVIPDWRSAAFSGYFGYDLEKEKHLRLNRWGVILGSRGCAFNCSFCFNFFENKMRYRSIHSISAEMRLLQQLGLQRVFFLDMTFTQNRSWVVELCQELIRQSNQLRWLCQTRCDCVDLELLSLMKQAGCCGVEFGVESYDDDNLYKFNKHIDTEVVAEAIQQCKSLDIPTSAFLMVGTPYESKNSIHRTIDMLKEKGISFIPIIYTPRVGSTLGDDIAKKYGIENWEGMLALRGKLSDNYQMVELIKDHSVMKGESMGTVLSDFNNTELKNIIKHHRSQFDKTQAIGEDEDLSQYVRNPGEKLHDNDMPFVSFPITSGCPFSCIYCGQGGENTISPISSMKLETIMDIAVYLKRAGVKKVRLTGGEPLLHPQIGDIIRFLSESGFYVLVNTNGLLVEDRIEVLMRTSSNIHFAVSLDTLDSQKFDRISRTTGNFDKVMRGIKVLKDLGYLMRINMVVGTFNFDEIDAMISFCRDIGCDLKLQEVASVPYPNSEWNEIHADLSSLEEKLASQSDRILVHDYARSFGIPVKIYSIENVMVTLKAMNVGSRYDLNGICKDCPHLLCHEGLYDIYILADGSIATCRWCRYGSMKTFGNDFDKAIKSFRNAEYIGKNQLEKMDRYENINGGVQRL